MPEPKSKQLSIIIVTYNDVDYLKHCIASIYQKFANFPSWEIIIVNNDKNQDIRQLPLDFSKIKLINHKKNIGFGSGINLGAKYAQGEFLLMLNPDTKILTENVQKVIEEFNKNSEVGVIGGRIIDRKNKSQDWSAGREISLYNLVRNNLGLNQSKHIWGSPEKIKCDWVTGTVLFIRKKLFNQINGFDKNFFMYFEDMDLCKRARLAGKKVILFPEFKIFHSGGQSYTDKNLQKKHYYDSMEYYFKKHYHGINYRIVKLSRWTKDKFLRYN